MAELRQMAELLRPQLKLSGPAPQVPHIMAAILVARDSLPARAACRDVEGVPVNVHGRINKLAIRVRALLAHDVPAPAPYGAVEQSPGAHMGAQLSAAAMLLGPSASPENAVAESSADIADLGLPPLAAVLCDPLTPSPSPALPEPVLPPPQSPACPWRQDSSSFPQAAQVATARRVQAEKPAKAAQALPRERRQQTTKRQHAISETTAHARMCAWSDQLPDDPHVVHASCTSYREDDGSSSSTCWNGSLSAVEKRMNDAAEEHTAEKRAAEKRAAEKRAAEVAAEQRAWERKHPGAIYDYDLYCDLYDGSYRGYSGFV